MKKTLLTLLLAGSAICTAQITTSTEYTPAELITDIFWGPGTGSVANISSTSAINFSDINSLGYFNSNGSSFPFDQGVILSTGNIALAPGPNVTIQSAGGWPGDAGLSQLVMESAASQNATMLEFDFAAITNQLSFNYIYASEEYGIYQCTYADGFAIILTDLGSGTSVNLGVVPGTTVPVSVNTVRNSLYNSSCPSQNHQYFDEYYTASNSSAPINFNGQTVPMTVTAALIPGHQYHLKFAIADRMDAVYDSALFLEAGAFGIPPTNYITLASNGYTLCNEESTVLSVNVDESYQFAWTLNGDVVENADSNSLTANEAGTYTVTVTLPNSDFSQTFEYFIADANETSLIYDESICLDFASGSVETPYVMSTGLAAENYTFRWTYNNVALAGATGKSFTASQQGEYQVTATDIVSGCMITSTAIVTQSSVASPIGIGYLINGQEVTFQVEGLGVYLYTLDGGFAQESNVFADVEYGTHTFTVSDANGCGTLTFTIDTTIPNAPEGDFTQTANEGDTLADLEVIGQNIQWYDNPGAAGKSANETDDTALPMSTLLTDGSTYYASQTINGVESLERLPVTVEFSLGTEQKVFSGFIYFPNPVADVLALSNVNEIQQVNVYNLLGQSVYSTRVTGTSIEINLSALLPGVYLVKVTSSEKEKVIKIVKE